MREIDNCPHFENLKYIAPTASSKVYKDECTQCFDNSLSEDGIFVCLTCFNGGCKGIHNHALSHYAISNHPLVLSIKKKYKSKPGRLSTTDTQMPPKKIQIIEETDKDLYETTINVQCLDCKCCLVNDKANTIMNSIMNATSAKQNAEIKAWEEEIIACEHTLCLEQQQNHSEKSRNQCFDCDMKSNLWLCLICGNVGCGRRQFDGSGGNNHGIAHFKETGHVAACKLGTITADGSADIYCYICDDMKIDPYLSQHLSTFGLNISQEEKTEKSMAELQLEQNLKWEFNMSTEDGKSMEPIFGPGLTGLKNIGNSCYLASVLQSVATLDFFKNYSNISHWKECKISSPSSCSSCQLLKMSYGLNSGQYSRKSQRENSVFQDGIPPTMLKDFLCSNHDEFRTGRQQDAYEFVQYLLTSLDKYDAISKPSSNFESKLSHRLQCLECHYVGYSSENSSGITIPLAKANQDTGDTSLLSKCINEFFDDEMIDDFKCSVCQKKVVASRKTRFVKFPRFMIMQLNRFVLDNWIPKKLNTKVKIDVEKLDLTIYKTDGNPRADENIFPENEQKLELSVSDADLKDLISMGFSRNRCIRALRATNNSGTEIAMEWLFSRIDDPSCDDPLEEESKCNTKVISTVSAELVESLKDMGFTAAQAEKALKKNSNNLERAVEWLFGNPDDMGDEEIVTPQFERNLEDNEKCPEFELHAVISHKGTSTACGHYVAYVKHQKFGWVLFNDEKVVNIDAISLMDVDGADFGYIYIWKKSD